MVICRDFYANSIPSFGNIDSSQLSIVTSLGNLFSSNLPGCDNNSASIGRGFQCERSALGGRAMHLGSESTCGTFLTKSANSHILFGRGKSFSRMSGFIRKYLSVCFAMRDQPTIRTLLTLLGTQEASRHHHVGGFPHRFPQALAQGTADDAVYCG